MPTRPLFWRLLLLVAMLSMPGPWLTQTIAQDSAEPFRVALTGRYPPFSFYGPDGQIQGFDVDVSRELGRRLGRPVEIIATEWAGIIPGLQARRYDAIIGSMAITPERENAVLFSRPYYISGAQLFVRSQDAEKFADGISSFTTELIGVGTGSTYEQYVTGAHPNLRVQMYPGEGDIFQDMRTGRLAGFVSDRLVGLYNAREAGEDFVPVGDLLYQERCAIPVRLDNVELHRQINEALDAMEADGFLDSLHDKWFRGIERVAIARDFSEIERERMTARVIARIMIKGFLLTLLVAGVSIIGGFLLAIPLGVGIKDGPAPVRWVLVGFSDIIRGTPLLVQLFFFYYGLGQVHDAFKLTPLQAGMLAMTLNAAAYMGEVVRSGLMSVQPGQVTGALALGLTRVQAFRFVVWPQAFRIMIPPLMNSVVGLLKDTALISVIGVAEVVTETTKVSAVTFQPLVLWPIVGAMFFIIAFPLMKLAQRLESRMKQRGYTAEN